MIPISTKTISFRVPQALREASAVAVNREDAKNQTDFILRSAYALIQRIKEGARFSELLLPEGMSLLEDPQAKMVCVRTSPAALEVIQRVATRVYLPTTRLILWAMALQAHEVPTAEIPETGGVQVRIPEDVVVQIDRVAERNGLLIDEFLVKAASMFAQALTTDVKVKTYLLPVGLWDVTASSRRLPTGQTTAFDVDAPQKVCKIIKAYAPRLYHTESSLVQWAAIHLATKQK